MRGRIPLRIRRRHWRLYRRSTPLAAGGAIWAEARRLGSWRLRRGVAFAAILHLLVALLFMIQLPWKRNVPQMRMQIPVHIISLAPQRARLVAPPPSTNSDRNESRPERTVRREPPPQEQRAQPIPVETRPEPEEAPEEQDRDVATDAGGDTDSTLTGTVALGGDAEGALEIGVEGPLSAYTYYLAVVRDKIARYWEPPAGIISDGKEVASKVRFQIDRRGKITSSYVEEPSGTSVFDQAGLRAIAMADPLPPLPQDYDGDWLGIHLRFVYKN